MPGSKFVFVFVSLWFWLPADPSVDDGTLPLPFDEDGSSLEDAELE